MNKKVFLITTVSLICLILFAISETNAQNKLQPYLSDLVNGKTDSYSQGLNAFADADYQKAYKLLKKEEAQDVPYREDFLQSALLYQRDNELIKKSLAKGSINIPESYKFFLKYPKMKLKIDKNTTSVELSRNLFKATLGDGEPITILLDTGGSGVGISEELVNKYRMKKDSSISQKGSLPAFDVTFSKHPVIIPEITIGDMTLTGIYAEYSVIDPESKGKYNGPAFDVIIGLDTFIGYLDEVIFDWENKKLIFQKHSASKIGNPFLFHSSKPFTSFRFGDENLTTILDTGSAVDLLPKEIYLKNYSKKEQKKYGEYTYNEYTVELTANFKDVIELKVADYRDDLKLVIGGEEIDLVLGNRHKKVTFNLKTNRFYLR